MAETSGTLGVTESRDERGEKIKGFSNPGELSASAVCFCSA